ncbi:hypothetical protein Agabi119p4_11576 [Agaricus bisporus var. burnettii]|uniref:Uncharacterized protein n=1 Tax=Agaricus bisporus var. burnettii TaxID=192524 RepID=A0A8H7EV31_AGABI|nr:hypothetical protein Agabi119p4_11576 [Agaricus bisporus var. burnettii]
MKLYCILRQNEHAPPPNKDQYTFHFYPFDTLPPFRSHLHPKFAIVELGRKYHELRGKNLAAASAALSSYPILSRVNRIYAAWLLSPKGTPLFEEWKNKRSTDGNKLEGPQSESSSGTGYDSWRNLGRQIEDEDRQSESTSNTGYDSWRNPFKRKWTDNSPDRDLQSESSSNTGPDSWRLGVKRRRTGNVVEQGCPTPAGKSSEDIPMANSSCETLSHRSLIEHERLQGKGRWTQENLSGWAADASNCGTP